MKFDFFFFFWIRISIQPIMAWIPLHRWHHHHPLYQRFFKPWVMTKICVAKLFWVGCEAVPGNVFRFWIGAHALALPFRGQVAFARIGMVLQGVVTWQTELKLFLCEMKRSLIGKFSEPKWLLQVDSITDIFGEFNQLSIPCKSLTTYSSD